jgi:hypothetical protein
VRELESETEKLCVVYACVTKRDIHERHLHMHWRTYTEMGAKTPQERENVCVCVCMGVSHCD